MAHSHIYPPKDFRTLQLQQSLISGLLGVSVTRCVLLNSCRAQVNAIRSIMSSWEENWISLTSMNDSVIKSDISLRNVCSAIPVNAGQQRICALTLLRMVLLVSSLFLFECLSIETWIHFIELCSLAIYFGR